MVNGECAAYYGYYDPGGITMSTFLGQDGLQGVLTFELGQIYSNLF